MLQRRLDLLAKVERLAETFQLPGQDAAYTCENAQHFFLHHVTYRWEEFLKNLEIAGRDGASIHKVLLRKKEREDAQKAKEEAAREEAAAAEEEAAAIAAAAAGEGDGAASSSASGARPAKKG